MRLAAWQTKRTGTWLIDSADSIDITRTGTAALTTNMATPTAPQQLPAPAYDSFFCYIPLATALHEFEPIKSLYRRRWRHVYEVIWSSSQSKRWRLYVEPVSVRPSVRDAERTVQHVCTITCRASPRLCQRAELKGPSERLPLRATLRDRFWSNLVWETFAQLRRASMSCAHIGAVKAIRYCTEGVSER